MHNHGWQQNRIQRSTKHRGRWHNGNAACEFYRMWAVRFELAFCHIQNISLDERNSTKLQSRFKLYTFPVSNSLAFCERINCWSVVNKLFTFLDLCVSSMRRGHANIFCIVPVVMGLRRGSLTTLCFASPVVQLCWFFWRSLGAEKC